MPDAGLRTYVAPIPGQPNPFGLLGGCTEVVVTDDLHQLNGTEFQPLSCSAAHTWQDCPDPQHPNPAAKVFDRPGLCSFAPVTVYAGQTCSTVGMSFDELNQRALEQLRMGEQRALEEWFMVNVLCTIADDLTPAAGALSTAQGVGVLENWLGTTYGGTGVLHIPAGAAAMIARDSIVSPLEDEPKTLMGNCLVFGAGYSVNVGPPACATAPSGEAWLYATGPVRVRRDAGALVPMSEGESVRTRTNDRFALAETTFVVEIACCTAAAVRVTLC